MPSFDEARRIILAIVAPWNMPFCDNSAMDGFAVRAADCQHPAARLKITGYLPAGGVPERALEPGCAIKIMTGAPIPPGCDAVVAVEETEESGAPSEPAFDLLGRSGVPSEPAVGM